MSRPYADEDVFRAIADGTRRRVLELLLTRDRTVTEIAQHFDCAQPTLSVHLRKLQNVGLVSQRRQGRHRIFSLQAKQLKRVERFVSRFQPGR